jgi:predicted negative regulator of RcsB-dependent stress response
MDTILSFFSSSLFSLHTLIILLAGMLVGWNIPQPAWAKSLWSKITTKAPVVETAANAAVAAETTVATEVSAVVDTVAPAAIATTTVTPTTN